jgi:hypothetical protein
MRQVDDFAIAAPDAHTLDILMDLIDDRLKIPIKRQGYLDMYNGIDIIQTRFYIKLNIKTYIKKIFEPYFSTWMKTSYPSPARSTPLPSDATWLKKFNAAIGDPDPKAQAKLAKAMKLNYRSGVGELIWAMTTCRPDLAYSSANSHSPTLVPTSSIFTGSSTLLRLCTTHAKTVCISGELLPV